jgi:sulfate adenylyltransferase subunit 1 (EFTu-like GTPase family)
VKSVIHPESLQEKQDSESLLLNDIGDVILTTSNELCYDPYDKNKSTGAFILIDESTNDTVAVGVLI